MPDIERHTIAVLVDNEPGILARVVGLFSGRGYNIDSLTVAEVDPNNNLSRITVVTSGTRMIIEQIKAQLSQLVPVRKVHDLTDEGPYVERELALIKVAGKGEPRIDSLRLADVFRARVVEFHDRELRLRDHRLGRKARRLYRPHGTVGISRSIAHRRGGDLPRKRRSQETAMADERDVVVTPGLLYAIHDGVELIGDLYLPRGADKAPVLVAAHGGGWQIGDRSLYQHWGPYLARHGYALFSIEYRLMKPGARSWPGAAYDVKAAIQLVRANAARLGVDPDRIGVIGDSAGAHLTALVALAARSRCSPASTATPPTRMRRARSRPASAFTASTTWQCNGSMTRSTGRATRSPRNSSAARPHKTARCFSTPRRSATRRSTRTAPSSC